VRLPALAWGEKDGTVTNSERRISRQRAFRAPPGQARPDWWMFAQVARRMGWADAFAFAGPADVFREHAALSAFENDGRRVFDIGALATLDAAAYDALAPTQWPCPAPGAQAGHAGPRLFARGGFATPDGRARMLPVGEAGARVDPSMDYPLTLNTGRVRDQWHTMTRTGRVPNLMTHVAGPYLAMHPHDAARYRIVDGGLARIESPHGDTVLRVTVDVGQRPGEAFAPMHWSDQFSSAGPIGRLVHAVTDPVSGQPDLKRTRVRIAAVTEAWRGLLLRRADGAPGLGEVYWSKAPASAGFAYDLSGLTPLDRCIDSERVLRSLLRIPDDAELLSYSDPKRSVFRYAGLVEGRLEACVFLAGPGAAFPEAREAARLLGQVVAQEERLALLAGVSVGVGTGADRIVCACLSVGEAALRAAIRARNLNSAAAIGAALGAGTNCSSCIPELNRLLAEVTTPSVAA
jgi:assimilatory nitrate reductase catalytic subunit